jgi:hypothetical protein
MNKKGFLTTVLTILLFLPLFILTQAYLESGENMRTTVVDTASGTRIAYYYDDIKEDYFSLLGLDIEGIDYSDSNTWINFSNFGRYSSSDENIYDYSEFINSYANKVNLDINIENFEYYINISPYSFADFNNSLNFYTYDANDIEELFLTVSINQSRVNLVSNSSPRDNGGVIVHVSILDSSNNELLSDNLVLMKTNGNNQQFRVEFNDGSFFEVEFENNNGYDGTLYTNMNDISANITNLDVKYSATGQDISIMANSNISITTEDGFSRSDKIVFDYIS